MRPHGIRYIVGGSILVLGMIACALPTQTILPTARPSSHALETSMAGTRAVSANQTEQAARISSTPSLAPTETHTPEPKISSSGTSLIYRTDGSTRFVDYVAGAQIDFPSGWLIIRTGEQEYYAAWEKPETNHPVFLDIFASMQNLDPKVFRMTALDIRPDLMSDEDVPQMEVVFNQGDTRTLNQVKKAEIETPPPLTGYKLLSSKLFEASQGIQALNLEIQWNYTDSTGKLATGYRKRVVFDIPTGIMAVDLIILNDKKDLLMPEFDQVLNSIILFTP